MRSRGPHPPTVKTRSRDGRVLPALHPDVLEHFERLGSDLLAAHGDRDLVDARFDAPATAATTAATAPEAAASAAGGRPAARPRSRGCRGCWAGARTAARTATPSAAPAASTRLALVLGQRPMEAVQPLVFVTDAGEDLLTRTRIRDRDLHVRRRRGLEVVADGRAARR